MKMTMTNAYDYIYSSIVSGKYPMGSAVPEAEVAEILHTSRAPVREALKKLEGQGIVHHERNRGTFVMNFSVQDISDLYDLRILLETYAVRNTIVHLRTDNFEKLLNSFQKLDSHSSTADYHKANQNLHTEIIHGCGNKWLEDLYSLLNVKINILNQMSTDSPNDFVSSRKEHIDIINSILSRDIQEAEIKITNHIASIKENTIHKLLYQ